MKKAKILAVFGILLAMGLTACNKEGNEGGDNQSQDTPASQQTSEGGASENTSSTHTHKWNAWAVVEGKEPTCTEPGTERRTCKECDAFEEREKAALGHDWENATPVDGSDTSTCSAPGKQTVTCGRAGCNATKEVDVEAHHRYGAATKVDASGEGKEYMKEVCSLDANHLRLAVNQSQVTYASGSSRKSGTPDGYTKLSSNNQSMSVKFNYDHFALGKLYLFGCMDGYSTSSNQAAGLYYNGSPNVEIKVNGSVVDVSAQRDTKYSDIFGTDVIDTELASPSDHLSHDGYFPIGDIFLQDGVNELVFTRKQTLNMLVKDFVFVIENSTHNHVAAETLSYDATGHWHACTAVGCPTGKADAVVPHTLVEVAPADDTETNPDHKARAATCALEGIKVEVCSCGYRKETKLDKLPHTLGAAYDVVEATCAAAGSQKKKCSECEEVITEVLPKLDHTIGDVVENYAAGEGYIATTGHNCSVCNKGALRWSALDFDTAESSTDLDVKTADKYVRFADGGKVENKNGEEATGSHIIYKINVSAAVEKAGLAFKIINTGGNGGNADVFGPIPNDNAVGYIKQADGTFKESTHRYGLRVNGVEYFLGDNNYGNKASVEDWFEWPVEFPLKAGINTIDVFAYRGYRAKMKEFELTGLPKIESSHEHNGDATWLSDANYHWHACTAAGCPIADGIYDKVAHNFVEVLPANDTEEDPAHKAKAASCTEEGIKVEVCSVCNYRKESKIEKLAHTYGDPVVVEPTENAEGSETYTCTACGDVRAVVLKKLAFHTWTNAEVLAGLSNTNPSTLDFKEGIKGIKASSFGGTNTLTLTYTAAEAKTATLRIYLAMKLANNSTFTVNSNGGSGFWYHDNNKTSPKEKTTITVNETKITAPAANEDIDYSKVGCTVADGQAYDRGDISKPVWVDICNISLQAGENTIVFQLKDTNYSYYFCGAALANN